MRGLTIVVAAPDADRLHGALSLAAANAALGGRARLFLQGEAAALIQDPTSPADERRSSCGVPTTMQLLQEAQALGAEVIVCQSGLALCGLCAESLPEGIHTAGLVQLLATLGEDQLTIA